MAVVKVTLTYTDGSKHDFLSLDDAVAMANAPHLHPDVSLTGAQAPEVPTPELEVAPLETEETNS